MASTRITLTADTWTQITTTDKEGSIRHQKGKVTVVYSESETAPIGFDSDTPISGSSTIGEDLDYYGIAASEFLFARAIGEDVNLTITPRG